MSVGRVRSILTSASARPTRCRRRSRPRVSRRGRPPGRAGHGGSSPVRVCDRLPVDAPLRRRPCRSRVGRADVTVTVIGRRPASRWRSSLVSDGPFVSLLSADVDVTVGPPAGRVAGVVDHAGLERVRAVARDRSTSPGAPLLHRAAVDLPLDVADAGVGVGAGDRHRVRVRDRAARRRGRVGRRRPCRSCTFSTAPARGVAGDVAGARLGAWVLAGRSPEAATRRSVTARRRSATRRAEAGAGVGALTPSRRSAARASRSGASVWFGRRGRVDLDRCAASSRLVAGVVAHVRLNGVVAVGGDRDVARRRARCWRRRRRRRHVDPSTPEWRVGALDGHVEPARSASRRARGRVGRGDGVDADGVVGPVGDVAGDVDGAGADQVRAVRRRAGRWSRWGRSASRRRRGSTRRGRRPT